MLTFEQDNSTEPPLEISGYDRLALRYPPEGGWDNRWEAIRTAAVQAFNTIREEVQRESQT